MSFQNCSVVSAILKNWDKWRKSTVSKKQYFFSIFSLNQFQNSSLCLEPTLETVVVKFVRGQLLYSQPAFYIPMEITNMMTKTRCLLLLQWSFGKYTWQFFVVFLFFLQKSNSWFRSFFMPKKVGLFCFKMQKVIILIFWKKFTFLKLIIVVEIFVYIF